jgi:hypothetical protein
MNLNQNRSQNHLIVVDNFFSDPKAVREFALSQEFKDGRPYYPGIRSARHLTGEMQGALRDMVGAEVDWSHKYCGVFQVMCDADEADSYVHHDSTDWAGVVYLSEMEGPGTTFYRHKLSGFTSYPTTTEAFRRASELKTSQLELLHQVSSDGKDASKWEPTFSTEFKFNRLVLYPGKHFHKTSRTWGFDKETGRLTQVFFLRVARN